MPRENISNHLIHDSYLNGICELKNISQGWASLLNVFHKDDKLHTPPTEPLGIIWITFQWDLHQESHILQELRSGFPTI